MFGLRKTRLVGRPEECYYLMTDASLPPPLPTSALVHTDGQVYPNVMMEHAYTSVDSRYLAPSKTQEPGHTVRGLPTPSCLFFRGKMLLVSYSQNAFLQRRSVLQIATHIVCSYSLWKR